MLGDTIFAIASPPGTGTRGIIRLSGPAAFEVAERVTRSSLPRQRASCETELTVLGQAVTCLVLTMPGPRSFTGEHCVELHLPGSPLLLEKVQADLREAARDALPGEFTRRAYEHGRLDLAEAEAVLDLIHASTREEQRHAVHVLRGGLACAVDNCRARLQDALALLESGLDFTEGETGDVDPDLWLPTLEAVYSEIEALLGSIPPTRVGGDLLLLGATNAGKSALCNALARRDLVLVSAVPGTTRDVLSIELGAIRLLDAPGDLPELANPAVNPAHRAIDHAAVALRDRVAEGVGAVAVVLHLSDPRLPATELPVAMLVFTKADLCADSAAVMARYLAAWPEAERYLVSSQTGQGIEALREDLMKRPALGPMSGGQRVSDRLRESLAPLARAMSGGQSGQLAELIALELQVVLQALDAVHGRSSPEDLLDRIFSRFCLGK